MILPMFLIQYDTAVDMLGQTYHAIVVMKFTADMYNIFRHFAYCQVSSDV